MACTLNSYPWSSQGPSFAGTICPHLVECGPLRPRQAGNNNSHTTRTNFVSKLGQATATREPPPNSSQSDQGVGVLSLFFKTFVVLKPVLKRIRHWHSLSLDFRHGDDCHGFPRLTLQGDERTRGPVFEKMRYSALSAHRGGKEVKSPYVDDFGQAHSLSTGTVALFLGETFLFPRYLETRLIV